MAERSVTAHLVIQEMCKELRMTEEQLLVHLAVENIDRLSGRGKYRVQVVADRYHRSGVFAVNIPGRVD